MKILHINSAFGMGGASVSLEFLHQELKQRDDIYSKLLVGDHYLQYQEDITVLHSKWNRWLNVAITRLTGLDSIWYPFVNKRRIKELIDWADLVHVHNLHGYFFPLKFLSLLQDKPVVWTLRDYWLISGRCAYFKNCRKWSEGCGDCPDFKSYPRTWFLDFSCYMLKQKKKYISALKNVTLVAISEQVQKIINKSYLHKFHSKVIYNGIKLPEVDIEKVTQKRIIAYCAFYLNDEIKGYHKFFDILRQLNDKEKYKIIVFGRTFPRNDKSILVKLGLEIVEKGYVKTRKEIAELLSSTELFVTTSLDEAFGKTTLEAMACGVPAMCFDIPIMREIGGRYAIYSPAFNVAAFVQNIERFFQTPYPYPGEELKRYAQKFSVARMTQSYLDLYERLLVKNC